MIKSLSGKVFRVKFSVTDVRLTVKAYNYRLLVIRERLLVINYRLKGIKERLLVLNVNSGIVPEFAIPYSYR